MGCIKVYKDLRIATEKSNLFNDLTDKYGVTDGSFIYSNVIGNEKALYDNSFVNWFEKNSEEYLIRDGEPQIDAYEDWLKMIDNFSNLNKVFKTDNFQSTTVENLNLNEGLLYYTMESLLTDKELTPNQLIELDNINVKNVLNEAFNKTVKRFNLVQETLKAQNKSNDRLNLLVAEVTNNRAIVLNNLNNYLDSKLKLRFNLDKVLSDDIETQQDKVSKDSAFTKESIEFDTKEGAPQAIKLLIASLPEIDERTGKVANNKLALPKLVNYTETFNYIQDKLVDIPGDVTLMIDKLKELSEVKPELKILIDRLNFNQQNYVIPGKTSEGIGLLDFTQEKIRQTLLRTQFVQQFDKYKILYKVHRIDNDGNIMSTDGNLDKIQHEILQRWSNTFEEFQSDNPNYLDALPPSNADLRKTLEWIGVDIKNLNNFDTNTVQAILTYGLKDKASASTLYNPPRGTEGAKNQLLKLAEQYLLENPDIVDLQQYNFDGKLIYSITLNNNLTTIAKKLNYNKGNKTALTNEFPELFNDAYSKPYLDGEVGFVNSIGLDKIINGAGIRVGIWNGFTSDVSKSDSKSTKDLKDKDLILQKLIGVLQDREYPFIRTADRGLEYFFTFEESGKNEIPNAGELLVNDRLSAKRYYMAHYQAESDAIRNNDIDVAYYREKNKEYRAFGYKKNGIDFELKRKDIETAQDPDKYVSDFVDNMIDYIIETEKEYLKNNRILDTDSSGRSIYLKELEQKWGDLDTITMLYALNTHIANIEGTKMFIGDLAFFKNPDDIFKRTSMYNSTKESLRVDDEINTVIDSIPHLFEAAHGHIHKQGNNSRVTTITINDVVSKISEGFSDQENDTLKEVYKEAKGYYDSYDYEMNEADGFAYVTIDEYRRMGIRASEWSIVDEKLYEKLFKKDYSFTDKTLHRWAMKKYQYSGKLFNEEFKNVNVPAGRKFAFLPLIPGMFPENSRLDTLNKEMLSNGVGMAFFTSAAKYGYTSSETKDGTPLAHHNFYEDLDFSENHDILDYEYMGNQLKIHNKPKKEIGGTQRNKIIKGNFYKNGKPINEEVGDIIKNIDELQRLKIDTSFENLRREFNLDSAVSELSPDKLGWFMDAIIRKGLKQGFNSNDLMALQSLKDSSFPLLDTLKNKQIIESLITSTLKNNVIDNKRKGDMLAQSSDVGFEIDITKEIADSSNRHNLKFYRYAYKADGKLDTNRMLPMEIMIPLPKHLMDYVSQKYGQGKPLTEKMLNKFNEDIAKDQAEYEKPGFVPGTESELTKIRTYAGFRIPTQDMASLEASQVKKFFMPHLVGMVVVPKAIVVKTGSDFDIDKLNFYIPHYKVVSKNSFKNAKKVLKQNEILPDSDLLLELLIEEGISIASLPKNMYEDFYIDQVLSMPESGITGERSLEFKRQLTNMNNSSVDTGVQIKMVSPKSSDISQFSKGEIENELLKNEINLTLHPSNHQRLLAPLDGNIVTEIVKYVRGLQGVPTKGTKTKMHEVFTAKKNVEKFIAFLSGKAGVGQVAVHITNHLLAQQSGLEMKAMHNYVGIKTTEEGYISLGRTHNDSNQLISEVLSGLLTAYVDIAKDPYILDINAVNATANTILMMIRWGVKPKMVFALMNQPIIKEYLSIRNLEESVTSNKVTGYQAKEKTLAAVLKKYGGKHPDTLIYKIEEKIEEDAKKGIDSSAKRPDKIYSDFTLTELEDSIKGKPDANTQVKALDLFLEYQRQSKVFQSMVRSTAQDTQRFKNLSILKTQVNLKDEVRDSGMFKNYDNLFDTFIGTQYDIKKKYLNLIKPLFLSHHEAFVEEMDALKELYLSVSYGEDNKVRITNKIENELISHIYGKSVINYTKEFPELFEGPNSIPKITKALRTIYAEKGVHNLFLNQMLPLINYKKQDYDSMRIRDKKSTPDQIEEMVSDFSLFLKPGFDTFASNLTGLKVENFANNILKFALIQSGINNSPFSLMRAIPHDLYEKLSRAGLASLPNLNITDFTGFNKSKEFVKIGEFLEHNMSSLFKKFGDNIPEQLKVNYDFKNKELSASFTDFDNQEYYTYKQKGSNNRMAYGTLPIIDRSKILSESHDINSESPNNEDNMLKCINNKK